MKLLLVLDDDAASLNALDWLLTTRGYGVLCASEPAEAIAICRQPEISVHLLITDVRLRSALSGTDAAQAIHDCCPTLPILFISGTPLAGWDERDFVNFRSLLPARMDFLQKPFTAGALTEKVQALIDSGNSTVNPALNLYEQADAYRKTVSHSIRQASAVKWSRFEH